MCRGSAFGAGAFQPGLPGTPRPVSCPRASPHRQRFPHECQARSRGPEFVQCPHRKRWVRRRGGLARAPDFRERHLGGTILVPKDALLPVPWPGALTPAGPCRDGQPGWPVPTCAFCLRPGGRDRKSGGFVHALDRSLHKWSRSQSFPRECIEEEFKHSRAGAAPTQAPGDGSRGSGRSAPGSSRLAPFVTRRPRHRASSPRPFLSVSLFFNFLNFRFSAPARKTGRATRPSASTYAGSRCHGAASGLRVGLCLPGSLLPLLATLATSFLSARAASAPRPPTPPLAPSSCCT